jgi:hypothetical protein
LTDLPLATLAAMAACAEGSWRACSALRSGIRADAKTVPTLTVNYLRQLLAAIRALAEANASLREVLGLAAKKPAMRADWAIRPQNPFQLEEGCDFIMKVRLCGAEET